MESYEQKYKAALEWMQGMYGGLHGKTKEEAEKYFPELKKSEDEKIREALLNYIKDRAEKYPNDPKFKNISTWIAWLEKQGEQKPADESKIKPKFKTGDRVIGIVSGMPYFITEVCDDHYNTESGCIIMFCSQDNFELYEQKSTEWSKEDEDYINDLIKYFSQNERLKNTEEDIVIWLESLRPQNTWKPSDEQMKALHDLNLTGNLSYAGQGQVLVGLYNDLLKLKA